MRAMPIQVFTGKTGIIQLKAAFRKNWRHYLQESIGLGIFMVSACFFSVVLFSPNSKWSNMLPGTLGKKLVMGLLMAGTALFIFCSRLTSPSGSHINPAVTLTFLRLGKMCRYDAMFFVIFQVIGGTVGVVMMQILLGHSLTDPPVNSAVTVPGKSGVWWALVIEFVIAFSTMSVVLFTSAHPKLKSYTRLFSAMLVCCWVVIAGPISGFGMNPARSFASAFPSGIWDSFWIYVVIPFAGMLCASELFLLYRRRTSAMGTENCGLVKFNLLK